ncbi:hypothetical protein DERP_011448 [Dermatophagoides pteronyssinus]|uniref:Uncharacterized protein n=1 Tax=Dermatophagoides pteronyssinus TaxID=6956 RepID=A0ABQ8J5G4_DERPT|nr:hypothetical protein DERP_011448 [Dermatophagoides pteronyssinus]
MTHVQEWRPPHTSFKFLHDDIDIMVLISKDDCKMKFETKFKEKKKNLYIAQLAFEVYNKKHL